MNGGIDFNQYEYCKRSIDDFWGPRGRRAHLRVGGGWRKPIRAPAKHSIPISQAEGEADRGGAAEEGTGRLLKHFVADGILFLERHSYLPWIAIQRRVFACSVVCVGRRFEVSFFSSISTPSDNGVGELFGVDSN